MKSFEEDDPEKYLCPDLETTPEEKAQQHKEAVGFVVMAVFTFTVFLLTIMLAVLDESSAPNKLKIDENENTNILKVVSMDFTADLSNSTTQHVALVSARWDLLFRVPGTIVGNYIFLQGNLQASFLYNNVTLVTSSSQSYKLETGMPQLLNVSAVATENDLNSASGREIMETIKERKEVRFGSRLSLTDCREFAEKGTVSFECDETTLRLEPGSDHIKATAKNHPTCQNSLSY